MNTPWKSRKKECGARLTAATLAMLLAFDCAPVWAQRRKAEPEVNPDFQDQMKRKDAGSPMDESASTTESLSEPSSAATATEGRDEKSIESRSVQNVQIGAASSARPTPSPSTLPLDARITVRVKGAPLATFLDTISAQAKVNFIITEGLEQKRITAFLQNVTVREALQVLLEIKGLTYSQIGRSNTYVVNQRSKQAENLITRIFTLSFIPLIPLTTDEPNDPTNPATPVATSGAGAKHCLTKGNNIAIVKVLCTVLSKSGDIELEPRTNAIIVTDIPEVFPQVEQIIAELDRKAPQVMIEAQIVEIDSDRTRNLGFEWGGTHGELASFTGGQRDTSFPLNFPRNGQNAHFFDPINLRGGFIPSVPGAQLPASATSSDAKPVFTAFSSVKMSVLDLSQLTITLRALVSRSEARFLGKPKILTLNNKTATMEITANEALAFKTVVNNSASGSNGGTEPDRYATGVKLKVTPQLNKEGFITMLVEPEYTDAQIAVISSANSPVYNPITRRARTLVRVKNGQTLVLGGLLRSVENKTVRKVPLLGYIPIIGWLFTSDLSSRHNTDLVIFITPTIVSD